jgi:hypothetical protein
MGIIGKLLIQTLVMRIFIDEKEIYTNMTTTKIIESPFVDSRSSETLFEKDWGLKRDHMLNGLTPKMVLDSPFIYIDRRLVALMLTRMKLFDQVRDVQGSVIECGVHRGNSLMLYYHLSSVYEPVALNRKIIGFDTFEGFPSVSDPDPAGFYSGDLSDASYEHLQEWANLQDLNRPLGHIPKIELIKGDACKTIPEYVQKNPSLIISLLYLDFDLYEPTLVALKELLPLIPKGGVVGFDEINQKKWKGETIAMKEVINIGSVRLKKDRKSVV